MSNIKTNISYVNQLCLTHDLDYLKEFSNSDKLFIEKLIVNINNSHLNDSIKNKQLFYLLNNYFNPSPYQIINYIYNVKNIYQLTSNKMNMNIYLFGDVHSNKNTCEGYFPNSNVAYFLDQQIKTSTKHLDIYVEEEIFSKLENKVDNKLDKYPLDIFIEDYIGCLIKDKQKCKYPHIRVHSIDLRKTRTDNPLLKLLWLFFGIFNVITIPNPNNYETIKNNINEIKIILENNKNIFTNKDKFIEVINNSFEQKLKKQELNIDDKELLNKIINYSNENWLNNIVNEEFKYINYNMIMRWINGYENLFINKGGPIDLNIDNTLYKVLNNIVNKIVDICSYFMDTYLILRLFRDYTKQIKYKYSRKAKDVIIYAGNWHIKRYVGILKYLDFKIEQKFKKRTNDKDYCLDISELKQPLFNNRTVNINTK